MKQFLVKSVLFFLPLIAGWVLLEIRLQKIPNSYQQKKTMLEKHMKDAAVINVGSSHALNGINPEYFSKPGLNLANITQTIYYDKAMVAQHIDSMPALKMVIIPVSYFTLFRRLEDLEEDWRMYLYYYYWGIDVPGKSIFDINRYSLVTIYTPHVVLGMIRRGFDVKMSPDYSALGFEGRDSSGHVRDITYEKGKLREQYHAKGYNPENVEEGRKLLTELISLLKSRNIEPVLVTTPVYTTFSSNANPRILADMKRITDEIKSKYGCRYFDYFTDPRFNIDDFSDNDHLNKWGATKFSKIIDSEIIRTATWNR
ncbi:MAG: hypothetical protein K9G49_08625 [Taibaiella sp.]|nr:hypothetical protein [Taibaiella sp.]